LSAARWEWLGLFGLDLSLALVKAEQNPCQSINCCSDNCPSSIDRLSFLPFHLFDMVEEWQCFPG